MLFILCTFIYKEKLIYMSMYVYTYMNIYIYVFIYNVHYNKLKMTDY